MMEFTQMTVDEIRAELVTLGLSQEDADSIKGKGNLIAKYKELQPIENSELSQNVEDENPVETKQDETVPSVTDYEWHDYVMSQFGADELVEDKNSNKKLPNVDGLRRLTEKLIGPILVSRPTVHKCPTVDDATASVSYEIEILANNITPVVFGGVGDSSRYNTSGDYAKYLLANAETRAEARALRKALRLRRVIAAEELDTAPPKDEWMSKTITDMQILVLNKKCKECNINLVKFINHGKGKYENIKNIPHDTATQMVAYVNEYARGEKPIPEEILGYEEGQV